MSSPIFARWSDNILAGAVITSTFAPSTSYALTTLAAMNPAFRVLFGVKTNTIIFTLTAAARGDILCIPMHGLTPGGSPGVFHLTNAAGFNEAFDIPALGADGFPPTLVVDLTALDTVLHRTSTVWRLVIVANDTNLVLGGAVAIYQKRTFADVSSNSEGSFTGSFAEVYQPKQQTQTNEYGTRYVQEYDPVERAIEWNVIGPNEGIVILRDSFLKNHGAARPSLLWPYPDEPDLGLFGPMFGSWQESLRVEPVNATTSQLSAVFSEWPKGKVIA